MREDDERISVTAGTDCQELGQDGLEIDENSFFEVMDQGEEDAISAEVFDGEEDSVRPIQAVTQFEWHRSLEHIFPDSEKRWTRVDSTKQIQRPYTIDLTKYGMLVIVRVPTLPEYIMLFSSRSNAPGG